MSPTVSAIVLFFAVLGAGLGVFPLWSALEKRLRKRRFKQFSSAQCKACHFEKSHPVRGVPRVVNEEAHTCEIGEVTQRDHLMLSAAIADDARSKTKKIRDRLFYSRLEPARAEGWPDLDEVDKKRERLLLERLHAQRKSEDLTPVVPFEQAIGYDDEDPTPVEAFPYCAALPAPARQRVQTLPITLRPIRRPTLEGVATASTFARKARSQNASK